MSDLTDAIRQVREDLLAGETFEDAVAFAAGEHGLNPTLLATSVKASYGDQIANVKVHQEDAVRLGQLQKHTRRLRLANLAEEIQQQLACDWRDIGNWQDIVEKWEELLRLQRNQR